MYESFMDFFDYSDKPAHNFGDRSSEFEYFRHKWFIHRGDDVPTLFDVIDGWLVFGQGSIVCGGRHDLFVLTVINIIGFWLKGEHRDVWRNQAGEQVPLSGFSEPDELRLSPDPTGHRLLNRTRFDEIYMTRSIGATF